MLARIPSSKGEKEALVAVLEVFRQVVKGHYYSVLYGRVGFPVCDLYHPGEGWLGTDGEVARHVARHYEDHPFCRDFFFGQAPVAYLRSAMVDEEAWHRTALYRELDKPLGIEDMIGLYFPLPTGHFGAVFCGRGHLFATREFEATRDLHSVVVHLLDDIPESVAPEAPASSSARHGLSHREAEVMHWVAEGKSNFEIGIILGISQHTVRKHIENIFLKMEVSNRVSAALAWNGDREGAKFAGARGLHKTC